MVKNTEVKLSAVAGDLKKSPSDALVIGVGQGPDGPVLLDNPLTAKAAEALAESLSVLGITGAADQAHRLPGPARSRRRRPGAGRRRQGRRRRSRSPRRHCAAPPARPSASWPGVATVTLALPTATLADVAAVAEGAALGAYSFTEYRSSKDGLKDPVKNVVILTDFAARQGPGAGPEPRRPDRQGRERHPLAGEPAAEPPLPRVLRRRRQGTVQGPARQGDRLGREAPREGRLRRHPRRRQGLHPAAAPGEGRVRPGQGHGEDRPRGQGHHLRHRRHLHQAGPGHGRHEERHGGRRRRP